MKWLHQWNNFKVHGGMNWKINYDFYCLSIVLKCLGMTNFLEDSKESYRWTFILENACIHKICKSRDPKWPTSEGPGNSLKGKVEYYQPLRKRGRTVGVRAMHHPKLFLSVQGAVHLLATPLSQQILWKGKTTHLYVILQEEDREGWKWG